MFRLWVFVAALGRESRASLDLGVTVTSISQFKNSAKSSNHTYGRGFSQV
jgi:hypothetical protein